jgi:hypothetical protein
MASCPATSAIQVPQLQVVAQLDGDGVDLLHGSAVILAQGQLEDPLPRIKMGLDPQIALAKGHEHRKVSDPMRRQIMRPQPKEAEEPPQEGMHQDSEPGEMEGHEGDDTRLARRGLHRLWVRQIPSVPMVEGRISHARATSSISPSAFDESHSVISEWANKEQRSSIT